MKIRIYYLSFCKEAIDEAVKATLASVSNLGLTSELSAVSLPTSIKRFCVLRSPHSNKDSREEFEVRIYKKFLDVKVKNLKGVKVLFKTFSFPVGVGYTFRMLKG